MIQNYLKVGVDPVLIEIVSEPYVIVTSRGYAPVVDVKDCKTAKTHTLFISAKSIADKLEDLRRANGNLFKGIELWISKESTDQMARYVIQQP